MIILGTAGTGIAYVLNYEIIEADGPTTASTVLYLLPVVAGVLGFAILDERIAPAPIVGTAIVLLGVFLCRPKQTLYGTDDGIEHTLDDRTVGSSSTEDR